MPRIKKKRKLLLDVFTIFASLFVSTAVAIIFYYYHESNKAIIRLSNDLINRTNLAAIEKLDEFFSPTPFVKISSLFLKDGTLQFTEIRSLTSIMHLLLQSYPQLISAYVADTHGNMFSENRVSTNPSDRNLIPFIKSMDIPLGTVYVSEIITSAPPRFLLTLHYKDGNGIIIKSENNRPIAYDPRIRPWYAGAKKIMQHYWLGTYEFYGSHKVGITAAHAIQSSDAFSGVAAADLSMDTISHELKNFSLDEQGLLFILNDRGEIITTTHNLVKNKSTHTLLHVGEIQNPIISKAYSIYQQTKADSFIFYISGRKYIAHFTPYAFSPVAKWQLVRILPLDVFVGTIKRANVRIEIFSMSMFILGLMIVLLLAHRISRPIIRLARETKDMVKLKFSENRQINTHIYEVQVMVDALHATKSALSSFAKYVPKTLVEQLLEHKIIAKVGGKKKTLSILFTDIAKFTSAAEQMEPELLMQHISEYLNALTQVIHHHQGTIDKYIGDAIMAFWGAPNEDVDQITHACEGALACRHEVRKLNEKWQLEGKPLFHTRFGLHTGSVIVGNMGSSDRLNYTIIGDAVNLTARLEALNKIYQTVIIVSEAVYENSKEYFLFRPLDTVVVQGKKQATVIYELIAGREGHSNFPATALEIQMNELWLEAYRAYGLDDLEQARIMLEKILAIMPHDEVAKIYIKRCSEFLDSFENTD